MQTRAVDVTAVATRVMTTGDESPSPQTWAASTAKAERTMVTGSMARHPANEEPARMRQIGRAHV